MAQNTPQSSPLKTISFLRNSMRAKEIAFVLLRNGFAELVGKINIPHGLFKRQKPQRRQRTSLWQRIRVTCEELGPTFIKFAQIISTREDIIPAPLIAELKKLRDQATPAPWDTIEPVIIGELDGGIEANFLEFDKTPAASGSVGQVYVARLKDGRKVAVKVRRPGAGKAMKADFEILAWLVNQASETIPELASYDLPGILEEIRDGVMREIDFTFEAKNARHFNSINEFDSVFAPEVITELSSSRVMVSEWIDGVPPGDKSVPVELSERLSIAGGKSEFHQIFAVGFFHADPHPGNILVTKDGRLCFLDWGCAGTLSRKMRYFLADIFAAVASMNAEKVLQIALQTIPPNTRVDKGKIETEIAVVLRKHSDFKTTTGAIGHMIFDMLRVFAVNKMPLPRDYALLAKSVIVMEESGRLLNQNFDLQCFAESALRELYTERRSPKTLSRDIVWGTERQLAYLSEMPESIQRILWKIESGEAKINIDHEGLNATRLTLNSSANRIALAMIIAALLVASALLVCASSFGGQSLNFAHHLGISGFIIAAVCTCWLFWLIVLRRK